MKGALPFYRTQYILLECYGTILNSPIHVKTLKTTFINDKRFCSAWEHISMVSSFRLSHEHLGKIVLKIMDNIIRYKTTSKSHDVPKRRHLGLLMHIYLQNNLTSILYIEPLLHHLLQMEVGVWGYTKSIRYGWVGYEVGVPSPQHLSIFNFQLSKCLRTTTNSFGFPYNMFSQSTSPIPSVPELF